MGDDAEYFMEQQAANAYFSDMQERSRIEENTKSLFCWVCGEAEDLWWSWEPMSRVDSVFFNLHDFKKIGSEYFLSCLLPGEGYDDDLEEEDFVEGDEDITEFECEPKVIDGLEICVVAKNDEASCEILVLSQKDVTPLKLEVARQKDSAKDLKETIISEMLGEMVSFMEANPDYKSFVFAREI